MTAVAPTPTPAIARFARYGVLSALSAAVGLATIALLVALAGWPPAIANLTSGVFWIGPMYLASRRWIWVRDSESARQHEAAKFWAVNIATITLATLVELGGQRFEHAHHMSRDGTTVVSTGLLMSTYAVLWALRFVLLDRILGPGTDGRRRPVGDDRRSRSPLGYSRAEDHAARTGRSAPGQPSTVLSRLATLRLRHRSPSESGRLPQDILGPVASAWILVGSAVAIKNGGFSDLGAMLLVLAGSVLCVTRPSPNRAFSWRPLVLVAVGLAFLVQARYPSGRYGSGWPLTVSRIASLCACALTCIVVGTGAVARTRRLQAGFISVLSALFAVASVSMVRASPKPRIDVWFMYQSATSAILHGHNPYGTHWTTGINGEVANGYSYLPGSAVLLAPFRLVFGDVRYGLIVAVIVGAWTLYAIAGPTYGWVLASLVLVFPKVTFGIEQAWVDPLLFALLALVVLLVTRGRTVWSAVVMVFAVSSHQYGVLLLVFAVLWAPVTWRWLGGVVLGAMALTLPFVVPAFTDAWHSIVLYPMQLTPRPDSLSLYTLLDAHGVRIGLPAVGLACVVAVAVCSVRLPRGMTAFVAGSISVLYIFFLFNKEVFYNDWQFLADVILLGAAVSCSRHVFGERHLTRTDDELALGFRPGGKTLVTN